MPKPTYQRINWENGTLVTPAKVLEDNTIQDAIYECDTPLNAENLNKMDKGISDIYEYGVTSNEIAISDTEPTNEDTLIWINTDGTIKFKNEDGEWQDTSSSGGENEIIGSAKLFFGNTEPNGYKFLNGQAISRTEYSELFSLIGTTYGEGDGTTTFNLPDMSGRVPVGLNVNKTWFNQLGKTGGSEEVTLTIQQIPSHNHILGWGQTTDLTAPGQQGIPGTGSNMQGSWTTSFTGEGQAHTNLQPYITVNYIIKVKNISSVPDESVVIGANDTPNDKDVYSSNAVNEIVDDLNTYSTTEKKIGTWIDGKPIYRRTFEIPQNHGTEIEFDLQTSITNIWLSNPSFIRNQNGTEIYSLIAGNYNGSSDYIYTRIMLQGNNNIILDVRSDGTRISGNGYVTFEYTKTTD